MNLVYIHLGHIELAYNSLVYKPQEVNYTTATVPNYMLESIRNSRKFYKDTIYVVAEESELIKHKQLLAEYNCKAYSTEELLNSSLIKKYMKIIATKHPNIFNNHFLNVTFLRLFVLESLVEKENLSDVFHIENDNLIYTDLSMLPISKERDILYTPVGDNVDSAGIMFSRNSKSLSNFMSKMLKVLDEGEAECRSIAKDNTITEMHILKIVRERYSDIVEAFPIMPIQPLQANMYGNWIYDGASWGQFFAGSNNGHPQGVAFMHHLVGRELKAHSADYKFEWHSNGSLWLRWGSYNCPFVNLHIHNKARIKEFIHD